MRSRICHALWSCGLICAIHLLLFGEANGSYFSGASPTLYYKGDELSVKVSEMTSRRTWIPVSYYAIPHCQPEKIMETGNLAGGLGGNGENSVYKFKMMEPERCHEVCRVKLDAKSAMEFKEKIEDGYRVNMDLDGLTLAIADPYDENSSSIYQQGFRIGVTGQYYGEEENSHFINNHLSFTIKYNRDIHLNSTNIVRFEVKEFSVHHYESAWGAKTGLITCEVNEKILHLIRPQELKETEEIIFTYSVKFEESDLKWASRWDGYVVPSDSSVHLFSVIWSFFMIALLFVKLGKLISRTLHLDTCRVSHLEPQGVTQEETRHTYVNNGALSSPPFPFRPRLSHGHNAAGLGFYGTVGWVHFRPVAQIIPRTVTLDDNSSDHCNNISNDHIHYFLSFEHAPSWGDLSDSGQNFRIWVSVFDTSCTYRGLYRLKKDRT